MFVTADCYEEYQRIEGTLRYDWMLSFTNLTPIERLKLHAKA